MPDLPADVFNTYVAARLNDLERNVVPALSEARGTWLIEKQLGCYVQAAEGAICDAGLLVVDDDNDIKDYAAMDQTTRLFTVLDKHSAKECILAIDYKTPGPVGIGAQVQTSAAQYEQASLYVLQSAWTPNLVAVVPPALVHPGRRTGRKFRTEGFAGSETEAFAKQISFCVMPSEYLGEALAEFLKFYREPDKGFRNPYNGIVIPNLPRPSLSTTDILMPDPTSRLRDLSIERLLYAGFKEHGTKCRFERMLIKPGVGDFVIVHTDDGVETRLMVEMKTWFCRISQNGTITHVARRDQLKYSPQTLSPRVFSSSSTWDYLLTTCTSSSEALFVSRDSLPAEWFYQSSEELRWQPGRAFLLKHLLPWDDQSREHWIRDFVAGVERILDQRLAEGRALAAQKLREFSVLSGAEVASLKDHNAVTQSTPEDSALVNHEIARVVQVAHRRLDLVMEALIKHQCRESGFGWIYRTPHHPAATHIYVPLRFANGVPPDFFQLPLSAPCIGVNFARIDHFGEEDPRVVYWPQFYRAVYGSAPSLYILSPFDESLMGQGLNCYIIPAAQLDGEGAIKEGVDDMFTGRARSKRRHFRLVGDESITTYAMPEDHIASSLERACRQWPSQAGDGTLLSDGMVKSRVGVMRDYLDVELGRTFLSNEYVEADDEGDDQAEEEEGL